MQPFDVSLTTTKLLDGLRESGNQSAWLEFDLRYRPILIAYLRRRGLDESDAADVAQETLACFLQDYRANKYDRSQGRLRSWLVGIARYRLADLRRSSRRRRELRGESAFEEQPPAADADEALWEAEERRYIFDQAVGELRRTGRFAERTLEAFERVVLRREPVEQVAGELGLTAQEIYNAKNRVVERLREIIARYESILLDA